MRSLREICPVLCALKTVTCEHRWQIIHSYWLSLAKLAVHLLKLDQLFVTWPASLDMPTFRRQRSLSLLSPALHWKLMWSCRSVSLAVWTGFKSAALYYKYFILDKWYSIFWAVGQYLCLHHGRPLCAQGLNCLEQIHHTLISHPLQNNTESDENTCSSYSSTEKQQHLLT